MTVEVDIREIKEILSALNSKIDMLIENRETLSLMMLAERSLREFLEKEPDIYSIDDIKVRYQ
ncbi:MAG: hypothetical protein DSO07_13100 [Thermoproteota archaeon]|jgi:hypothetical protein|uniref:Uncharacterized protein n=1 Tax=Candidatus Methanodesulfokora washburnensis TaxID=2478471 RepID=A0A429GS42_9CREN|nr:hypothetical protein [Candidatus Methanodesulfokores washburnensis]RSN76457.1 hypothetical protein D6D85_04055 [Candidatus Methanodesulfokores washburnensis]TDA36941.1 MAG: hypothetical protein DSO07_13100 [Candidatus Korarchaeota archaeon]